MNLPLNFASAEQLDTLSLSKQVSFLLEQMQGRNRDDRKIVLRDSTSVYFVKISDIAYCKADGVHTAFSLLSGEQIVVFKNLKEYEALLQPSGFLRCYHSQLVNAGYIKALDKTDGGMLVLETCNRIPVSTRKREYVLRLLGGG